MECDDRGLGSPADDADDLNFADAVEEDDFKFYEDDSDGMMDFSSLTSEKYHINSDINMYFGSNSKDDDSKKAIKGPVKKNRSAYNLFIKDRFSKKNYSKIRNISTKEAMDRLIKEWKELPEKERLFYEEKAQKEKEAYQSYKKSRDARQDKLKNKLLPKRPIAPYTLFQIEERKQNPEMYKDASLEQAAKEIALKWKNLEKNAKSKYLKAFNAQSKAYNKAKKNLKVQQIQGVKVKCEKKKVHQPFVAFIREHYMTTKTACKALDHKTVMAKLSEKWKLLTAEEKETYKMKISQVKA